MSATTLSWAYKDKAKDYARFWVIAESKPGQDTTFTVRPYRGMEDNFGTSNKRNLFPGTWGDLGPQNTWWSFYNLPLIDKETGFRRETYTSKDGSVPTDLADDFLRLYKTGINRGILKAPRVPAPAVTAVSPAQ